MHDPRLLLLLLQGEGVDMLMVTEDGLHLVVEEDDRPEEAPQTEVAAYDPELESLRSEFVAAFNARDMEAVLGLVHPDVECPDRRATGLAELAQELALIWDRSPGAVLTDALLDGTPCAVAWLAGEDGCWCRAALVCLDAEDGLLRLFELPEDPDALDRAEADLPEADELDQGLGWVEWDTGEDPTAHRR
jgi:hypothetical protein